MEQSKKSDNYITWQYATVKSAHAPTPCNVLSSWQFHFAGSFFLNLPLSTVMQISTHKVVLKPRNQSIYNIIRWVAGTMGQMNRRPSVWCSKYYFFQYFLCLGHSKLFVFFYFKEFCKKSWKKIILLTSNTWSTICLAHRPSDPAYYIVDWLISELPELPTLTFK